MRVRGQEQIDRTVGILSNRKIASQVFTIRTPSGETEAEIRLQPTDDLIAIGLALAEDGFRLHYDGRYVRVITPPANALPDTEVAEEDLTAELPSSLTFADGPQITGQAHEFALAVGLRVQDLVEQQIGTGKDGRIVKEDVSKLVQARV